MSNHSIIEHRACYHFVKAEEDYIAICSSGKCSPHCKALILAVLESWANAKGKDTYVYMSLPQWITATYMFYERNVISDSIQELLDEKLIERQPIVKFGQKTFEYKLSIKKVQELVKTLPEKESEHLPDLDKYIAFKTRSKAGREKKAVEKSTTPKSKGKKSTAVEKSTTSPLINQLPAVEKSTTTEHEEPLINQRNIDSNNIDSNLDINIDITDTAHADVSTSQESFSENKVEEKMRTPETGNQEQESGHPAVKETRRRRNTGKSKQSKKNEIKALLTASEIAAPKKPDPATHPYNGELFMELADYYRGSPLPESNQPNSLYMQAVNAAASLVQRKARFEDVDKVFRFLLGLDEVKDLKWIEKGYNTDLWIVARHLTNKCLEYQRLEQSTRGGKPTQDRLPPTSGNTITHGQRAEDYTASSQVLSAREKNERKWAEAAAAKVATTKGA